MNIKIFPLEVYLNNNNIYKYLQIKKITSINKFSSSLYIFKVYFEIRISMLDCVLKLHSNGTINVEILSHKEPITVESKEN